MMQSVLDELTVYPVADRGVPNQERVPILVNSFVDMASFGLLVGQIMQSGGAVPIGDHFFWFGNAYLKPGDWIFVYTGAGKAQVMTLQNGELLYSLYWGRKQTVFHSPLLYPIAIRMDAIQFPKPPEGQLPHTLGGPLLGGPASKEDFF